MQIFLSVIPNFGQIIHIAFVVIFQYYGWLLFVIGLIYMLWRAYLIEIQHQYVHNQPRSFLHIRVPRENMVSTLAVEQIFSQMHALHVGKTPAEKYVEGHIQLWYSLEVISMGGKISFIMMIPTRMRDVVESAVYAHYPQAEISETTDYMDGFHFDPYKEDNEYDIFGTEWRLNDDDVIPIKTYKDFEHTSAEEKIIDPLANFFEGLAKIQPYEFVGFQIIIQPLADDEWQPRGLLKVKELTEQEIPHKATFLGFLLAPFEWFAKLNYREAAFGHHGGHEEQQNKPRSNWMSMTESEKERVNLIEAKVGKPGYKTKIRTLYVAPKDKFDQGRKGLLTGLYRPVGSVMTNKLKPDTRKTWTSADYLISKAFEQPYLDWLVREKKRKFIKGYKTRDIHIGFFMFILNIEELATIYHFPITTKTTLAPSAVQQTESKKSQAPANLPVANDE